MRTFTSLQGQWLTALKHYKALPAEFKLFSLMPSEYFFFFKLKVSEDRKKGTLFIGTDSCESFKFINLQVDQQKVTAFFPYLSFLAELNQRSKRARVRSPIAKEMW